MSSSRLLGPPLTLLSLREARLETLADLDAFRSFEEPSTLACSLDGMDPGTGDVDGEGAKVSKICSEARDSVGGAEKYG